MRKEQALVLRVVWQHDGCEKRYVVANGETSIGSASDNAIVIPNPQISRTHAVLVYRDGLLEVRDMGSKNGTFVNGQRIEVSPLQANDLLALGPIELKVEAVVPDDTRLGLRGSTASLIQDRDQSGRIGETDTATHVSIHKRALHLLNRIVALLSEHGKNGAGEVLDALRNELDLTGAAIVRFDDATEPIVLVSRGSADELATVLAEYDERLSRNWASPNESQEVLTTTSLDAKLVSCAAMAPPLVLVVWGHGATDPVVNLVLPAVARVSTLALGQPSRPPSSSHHTVKSLELPDEHVRGEAPAMHFLYAQMAQLTTGALPILITGETGVGKEHVARILHLSSPRRKEPFEAVNCAAIPSELLESELFGIERGVATGVTQRPGKMVLANGGVLFLDEIGDMALPLQSKLLRALQEREVLPLGARRPHPVDVWVLAATNGDPQQLVASGQLRRDLYYRLAGCTLHVPPLRERREDIPRLIEHFLHNYAAEARKHVTGVTIKALRLLQDAPWPGNIRQLEHEIRRAVYLCADGQPIDSAILSKEIVAPTSVPVSLDPSASLDLHAHTEVLERTLITTALARTNGNRLQAAKLLGISRDGLRLKMTRLGLDDKGSQNQEK